MSATSTPPGSRTRPRFTATSITPGEFSRASQIRGYVLANPPLPPNSRRDAGKYVKSLVFGGLDGIITTFAVVAASVGGSLSSDVILLMGFANLIADGLSMGFGDYLSSQAEVDYTKAEHRREKWELEKLPRG